MVHLSIHDVSPAFEREVDLALALTRAIGARPALLVVPNFHGEAALDAHPDFCAKLRALQAEGHEIFLHGYFHRARRRERASLGWHFAQKIVSAGEAEFQDVTREEADERLTDGEQMLARAGLAIDGFVAPAWGMPRWLLPLLAQRG